MTGHPELVTHKTFGNNPKGFDKLIEWLQKITESGVTVRFVMEATGVYHESFAYFLHGQNCEVSIILPNKISNYARTLNTKTVTDKTASEAIAMFGLERQLDNWTPPKASIKNCSSLPGNAIS